MSLRSLSAPILGAALLLAGFAVVAPSGVAAPGGSTGGSTEPKKGERDLKAEDALRKLTKKVGEKFGERLAPVISFACEKGLKDEATAAFASLKKGAGDWKGLEKLEKKVAECGAPADETKVEADRTEFQNRLKAAYKSHGEELMKLAMDCAKVGMFARAFDLIGEVVDFDPDNRDARRLLGWVAGPDAKHKWITKFEAQVAKDGAGVVDEENPKGHEKGPHVLFVNADGNPEAWILKKDLAQWQKGLRPFAHGWVPAEEEQKKRSANEQRAWVVESEHFQIHTNISRVAAYDFGWDLLEDYYRAFLRHYFTFFEPEAGAKLLFDVSEKNKAKKKHVVYLYPSMNDYLDHVKAEHGNDELLRRSAGFYSPSGDSCSHFYAVEDRSRTLEVLYHEVAHQLFEETKSWKEGGGGAEGNNWVPEGTAMYSETWEKVDGKWIPGHRKDTQGLRWAKEALGKDGGAFNLTKFIAITHKEFHEPAVRTQNYFMAQALSYFLMEYDDGRYKEDFIAFIAAYYGGKVKPDSLYDYIQVEGVKDPSKRAEALEKQFKEFIGSL